MRFFDYNATSPLLPEAREAWLEASECHWYNPSSPYRSAAQVQVRLEAARAELAELVGADSGRLTFNSGATEGNNSVFAHWAKTLPASAKVGVSPTEHPSVLEAARRYFGDRIVWLKLDGTGVVDLNALSEQLQSPGFGLAALSVMAANNETGLIHPWETIAQLCRAADCQYHCDASQWLGKMPGRGLGQCSFVTGCAHKFGGPRGVGFLLLPRADYGFLSLLGGPQEFGRRAGTVAVPSILAMVAALQSTRSADPSPAPRDAFLESLRHGIPAAQVIGASADRLWNTVSVLMPEFASVRWIRALERRDFLVSAGSACSTGKEGGSHVLAAMGVDAGAMRRVLRISSGRATSQADWDALCVALIESYQELRADASGSGSRVISI